MGGSSSRATSHVVLTALDPSVAKALVGTLPVSKVVVLSHLAGGETGGEERCKVGWFVLSSSPRRASGGWPALWVKSLVFSRISRSPEPWTWTSAAAAKCLALWDSCVLE